MVTVTNSEKEFFAKITGPILIYGCTSVGKHLSILLQKCGFSVLYFIDRSTASDKKKYFGYEIINLYKIPQIMKEKQYSVVITVQNPKEVISDFMMLKTDIVFHILIPKQCNNGNNRNNELLSPLRKILLKNQKPTIISNNCSDLLIYTALGITSLSPLVGSAISNEDFLKLCQNFEYYMLQPLEFEEYEYHGLSLNTNAIYPVGRLEDIKIHFGHSKDWAEVKTIWKNLCKKINYNSLFFVFSDYQQVIPYQIARNFSILDRTKCLMLCKSMYYLPCVIYNDVANGNFLDKSIVLDEWFDIVGWINKEFALE